MAEILRHIRTGGLYEVLFWGAVIHSGVPLGDDAPVTVCRRLPDGQIVAKFGPTPRGTFDVLHHARLQTGARLHDGSAVTAYRAVGGGPVWVRPTSEMDDGRFETVRPDSATPSGDGGGTPSWMPQAKDVTEAMQEGGHWRSCSGCHEANEGCETGHYPYSPVYQCYVGSGCHECGGIGVVWEPPIDEVALLRSAQAANRPAAAPRDLSALSAAACPSEWCGHLLMEMTEADSDYCDALVNGHRSGRLVERSAAVLDALIQCQAELASIHNLHGDRANAEAHSLGLRMANATLSAADATNPQD